jgi:transcriptional regulator with XRE-family HTH domain
MEPGQCPNQRLRLQRRLRGWSQDEVAAGLHRLAASLGEPELGVDATMVGRWERGTRRPRPRYVRLLCRLFELSADQLGVIEEQDLDRPQDRTRDALRDALEEHAVERRDFIHRVTGLLGLAAAPLPLEHLGTEPWERLTSALHGPGGIDEEAVDHLEWITLTLQRLGRSDISSEVILGPVVGHLDAITHILGRSLAPSLRARLCSLAGETAGFAGWLRWNVDDAAGAASYFATGLEAAREGGDRALAAYLVGSAACQPPYRESPQRRLDQLDTIPWSDPTPSSRVWLAAKAADAHALLGDAGGCQRALERAEVALAAVPSEDDGARRPRFSGVDRNWLDGERGASLAKLGQTADARATLQQVMAQMGPSSERDRLWLSTSLVSTHIQDGEPEQACRVACAALEQASRMQLQPILRIMRGLRDQLTTYGPSPAIQELDERLRISAAPRAAL